jgi:hypothetical protein
MPGKVGDSGEWREALCASIRCGCSPKSPIKMVESVSGEQKIVLAIEIRWVCEGVVLPAMEIPVISVTPLSIIVN